MKDEQAADDLFIMVHVDHDETVLAKWQAHIFFDVTHGGKYEPMSPLIFEVKAEIDFHKKRTMRLYEDGVPSLGGQWHSQLETAFMRAEYVASCYIHRRRQIIENEHRMVRLK